MILYYNFELVTHFLFVSTNKLIYCYCTLKVSVLLVSGVEVTKLALVLSVLRGMGQAGAMGTVPGQEGGGSVNLDFPS